MSSPKKSSLVDPDYELTEVAREHVKFKENAEHQETLEKIIDIINREFKTELDHRQSQLDLIQQRLCEAQKTLHLLRYVLINTYYNEQHLFVQNHETSHCDNQFISNKNRMHPAVKNLMLSVNSNDYNLNVNKSPRKKMKFVESVNTNESADTLSLEDKASELNNKAVIPGCNTDDTKPSNDVSPQKEEFDMIRNRKRSKYRIVVGNISKWMPSESEEDKSTHKWMVYVRGSKENPDISHFVEKVVFYLHPSYQPNDVVELRHPPFHLARRGWGEFPLRVKIFFQYSLNKPVDIIHNLKLDKTFTGQQTLGNETIVNLFLYKKEKRSKIQENENFEVPKIKEEVEEHVEYVDENSLIDNSENVANESTNYVEHDYCTIGLNENLSKNETSLGRYDCYKEHSYARMEMPVESEKKDEQSISTLEHEINDSELKVEKAELKTIDVRHTLTSNKNVFAIKKVKRPQESVLKKTNKNASQIFDLNNSRLIILHSIQSEPNAPLNSTSFVPIDYKKYKIHLPKGRFKTARHALPYLFKRMPLITGLASNLHYRCTFPFAAKTLEEYSSWNIGKRLSAEWYRAKMVLNIIREANLKNYEKFTAKVLIMYARSYGYTPLAKYEIFNNNACAYILNSEEQKQDDDEYKMPIPFEPEEVLVDVINCTSDEKKQSLHKIKLVDQKMEAACSFVRHVVLDRGIILKPQEIIPDVVFNGAERMLLQALLCLAEDLIRRARTNLVYKENFQEGTSTVCVEDIRKALTQRPQFKHLTNLNSN